MMENDENLQNLEIQENEATKKEENEQTIEAQPEVKDENECERKLHEAEEKIADYEKELKDSKTHIDQFAQQKIDTDKEIQLLKRERENVVLQKARVELILLDAKNLGQSHEKKIKDLQKEIDLLNGKIKQQANDKTRICGILDEKCHEFRMSQKEVEKLKYEHTGLDSRLKWHIQKVKLETDAREKAEKKVEELTDKIKEMQLQEISRVKEEVEVEKNMLAEKQLMEVNASMILLKHDNDEKTRRAENLEKKYHKLEADLDSLNRKYNDLHKQHDDMLREHSNLSQQNSDSQFLLDKQTLKIAELQSNQNELEVIRTQLSLEKENNRQLKNEVSMLTAQIDEQNEETEKWKAKEIELLQLNKELTETVVTLKNECSMSTSKATAMSMENELIKKDKSYYENIISDLRTQLDEEIKKRNSDCQLMAKHISEKTKANESLQRKIEELTGEIEAQRNKNLQHIKELNRDISHLRKKVEQNGSRSEKHSPTPSIASESESSTESHNNEFPTISFEPSQKSLVDRIVRLQNEIVRKSEKIDFLENHQAQLVEELKKKSKLLHHYLLREQAGQLVKAKKVPDLSNITFELSMEINRKLQNTLEDTILKNITLKENLDTISLEMDQMKRMAAARAKK